MAGPGAADEETLRLPLQVPVVLTGKLPLLPSIEFPLVSVTRTIRLGEGGMAGGPGHGVTEDTRMTVPGGPADGWRLKVAGACDPAAVRSSTEMLAVNTMKRAVLRIGLPFVQRPPRTLFESSLVRYGHLASEIGPAAMPGSTPVADDGLFRVSISMPRS